MEQGSNKPQENLELLALKDQVSKLTSEKAALVEKNKMISKDKKWIVSAFIKQSTCFVHLVFIRISFNQIHSPQKIIKD